MSIISYKQHTNITSIELLNFNEEYQEGLKKLSYLLCTWIKILNIFTRSFLPKLIYKFITILIKIAKEIILTFAS